MPEADPPLAETLVGDAILSRTEVRYSQLNMPEPAPHSIGSEINRRYKIIEFLGGGASGEVYAVQDTSRGKLKVAVKYLKWLPEKPDALNKFKTEFAMLTHLSHPHIAKVYDLERDEANKQFFFTSEFIDGMDFMNAVRGLSVEQIEELFVQALRALEYIHGNGIFHFDIKSLNLLVTSPSPLGGEGGGEGSIQEKVLRGTRYHLKLIDFGMATIRYQGKKVGTPSYMSPEMISRENPDGRSDLYSLGVLVYSALAGKNPFRTKSDINVVMQNQLNLIPPPPSTKNPNVPPYLDTVLLRLMEKRPSERYQTAGQAIRDLSLRSPKRYAVETEETKESYIPWESKFIGRAGELARIKELLMGKRSAVVVVQGASGSGKSRFLTEVKYQAQVAEWATFFLTDPSQLEEWEKNVSSPSPLVGEGRGEGELKNKQPMLVAIDDYDILTKELWGARIEDICKKLERKIFAKQKDKQPVILILAVGAALCGRPQVREGTEPLPYTPPFEKGGPGGISSDSLSLDPTSESLELELSNFTSKDIRDYLATITGIPSPPQALVEHVHTNTGGNPFVVTEVIKTLVSSGMLVDSQGRWKSTTFEDIKIDLAKMDVPANVEDRLLRDMEGVPEEARSMAQMMAVFGAPMELNDVGAALSGCPQYVAQGFSPANVPPPFEKGGPGGISTPPLPSPSRGEGKGGGGFSPSPLVGEGRGEGEKKGGGGTTRGALLMLVRRGLVRINAIDGTYYFARPLLAKAIYSRMSEPDRTHWHDRIASVVGAALSGRPPVREGAEPLPYLYHLSRGSDQAEAKSALKKLVESCTLAQRNHDAILHAQYYLEKWNDPEMRLNLARLYNRIGKYDLAIKTAEDINTSIRSSGLQPAMNVPPPFEKGGPGGIFPSPLVGEGRLPASGVVTCPPCSSGGAGGEGASTSPDDTLDLSETTRSHEITALEIIGTAYLWQKNFNAARQHFLAALQMTSETPSPQKLRIENFLAEVAYFEGNTDRAIDIYERTAKEAEALPPDEQLQIKNNNLGQSYFQKGEYKKAIAQLEKELELYRSIEDSRLIARTCYSLAESLRMEHEFDKARAQFDALILHAKQVDDVEHLFRGFNGMGNLLVDAGKLAEAAEYYERALDVSMRAGYDDQSISCIANLGVVNSNTGNLKKAKEYFTSALAYLEGERSSGGLMSQYHCRMHLELGEIYRLEKNYEEARKQLDEAAEITKLPNCRDLLFWVRLTQAKIAREEGDQLAVNALLDDAKELADTPDKLAALKLAT